jgi:hypothetical protein
MSAFRSKFGLVLLTAGLCTSGLLSPAGAQKGGIRRPPKKKAVQKLEPAPLPPYTPVPLQPVPLDQVPAVAPKVNYQGGQLTIEAHNSTLADVLRAVHKQTGAELEIPPNSTERVVADIGPGPARDVLAELLNGTHFNYVMVGSATDPSAVQSIVLTARTGGPETARTGGLETASAPPRRPGIPQRVFPQSPQVQPEDTAQPADDGGDGGDENADQADAQDEQQQQGNPVNSATGEPQTPKTPEQLLQELQRQQQQPQPPPQQGQPPQGIFPNQPPTAQPNPTKPD